MTNLQGVHKIAILRALHLGDLLLAVPAFRSIRAGFPSAEISLIGLPWARAFAERFSCYIDRFVEFGGFPGIIETPIDPQRSACFIDEQRAKGYDLVIQLHGNGSVSNACALAFEAKVSAGLFPEAPPEGLTIGAPYPGALPEVERNLTLARLLGCPDLGDGLEFPLFDRDQIEADDLLAPLEGQPHPWIGVHAGARAPARRWSERRFAAVANELAAVHGASIILTGGPGEEASAEAVGAELLYPALNLAGRTSLGGLAAIIARLDLFISNDTGPAHIADALGTPSVTIFGPADPVRWAPLDQIHHPIVRHPVDCSPCPHWECPIDHRCLQGIEAGDVIGAAGRLLSQVKTGVTLCDD